MSGTVTATAGAIGGFTISNNDITGSGGTFVTSNRRFSGFGRAEDTSRVELSKHNLRIVTAAGDPYSTTGYLPSHIVFDAIVLKGIENKAQSKAKGIKRCIPI